ncbi:MAE_28990/MAE_18760 family HEPN-like nuclease [Photobacterium sp. DA100]|uniref:MAE_28990/MAE_18760 family HEPN-like nuclease n=1 Tax=Photobacterium sp. DA100 TaxID=3027472 RepID=UPI0024796138|nr:MAE_28990/MAE_18760 family HEPN-like nuclease [Photobacterium sp. DA100]WEM42248.1 MAE_28990/MAE_18760 family HEPN-like nuclease [Photobacterium sp. DA100]
MQLVRATYDERVSDIEAHFELIKNISDAIGSGGARFPVNGSHYTITIQQQRILFSSTYLQLYNLVESTVNQLLSAVGRHSQSGISGDLTKLSDKIRDLYLKHMIPPEDNLTPEKRLQRALKLLHQAVGVESVEITIPRGGGGNWDMIEINRLNNRIGVDLTLPAPVREKLNRPYRNDKGPLRYIKEVRNNLGHGSISFADCGTGHVYSEFRTLIDIVKEYLEHLMNAYEQYIDNGHYLSTDPEEE